MKEAWDLKDLTIHDVRPISDETADCVVQRPETSACVGILALPCLTQVNPTFLELSCCV